MAMNFLIGKPFIRYPICTVLLTVQGSIKNKWNFHGFCLFDLENGHYLRKTTKHGGRVEDRLSVMELPKVLSKKLRKQVDFPGVN